MTLAEELRDALDTIDAALHDHEDYGPYYDDKELAEIYALRDRDKAQLQALEREGQ